MCSNVGDHYVSGGALVFLTLVGRPADEPTEASDGF
jgi:hypothetical protein